MELGYIIAIILVGGFLGFIAYKIKTKKSAGASQAGGGLHPGKQPEGKPSKK